MILRLYLILCIVGSIFFAIVAALALRDGAISAAIVAVITSVCLYVFFTLVKD